HQPRRTCGRERSDGRCSGQVPGPGGRVPFPGGGIVSAVWIVFRKELREILRDRRTLIAIGLAAVATPTVLFVIAQVSTRTVAQAYTIGYSGDIPTGLQILFDAVGLKLVHVDDPAAAAKPQVDSRLVFSASGLHAYYAPTRRRADRCSSARSSPSA